MAGPTDILTEDVKDLREANRQFAVEIKGVFERLSADLRDSTQHMAEAISEVARDLGTFRVEVAKELGTINAEIGHARIEVARDLGELRTQVAKELGTINAEIGHSRVEVAKQIGTIDTKLGDSQIGIAKELGAVNTKLEKYQGRTEAYLSVARYVVATATIVVLGLIGWSYSAYERAVRIEQSIIELRQSVVELREHAKEQDERIDKLIELQRGTGKATTSKTSATPASRPDRSG